MAGSEKPAVSTALTGAGTSAGVLPVASTAGFYEKQRAWLNSGGGRADADGVMVGADLNYNNETRAFIVGQTLTGTLSGHTAVITGVVDNGATGTLTLSGATGTFQNLEALEGSPTAEEIQVVAVVDATNLAVRTLQVFDGMHLNALNYGRTNLSRHSADTESQLFAPQQFLYT